MANYCSWIEHQNVKILFCNFTGIKDQAEYLRAFDEMEQVVLDQPKGSVVPSLVDISGSMLSPALNDRARKMTARIKEAGYPNSPTAMVGASGLQKAIIAAIGIFRQDIQNFDDLQSAKDWLVKQV